MCRQFSNELNLAASVIGLLAVLPLGLCAQSVNSLSPSVFTTPTVKSTFPGAEVLVRPIGASLTDMKLLTGGGPGMQTVMPVSNGLSSLGFVEVAPLDLDVSATDLGGSRRPSLHNAIANSQLRFGMQRGRGSMVMGEAGRFGMLGQALLARGGIISDEMMSQRLLLSAHTAYVRGAGLRTPAAMSNMNSHSFDNPPMPNLAETSETHSHDARINLKKEVAAFTRRIDVTALPTGTKMGAASIESNRELVTGRKTTFMGLGRHLPVPRVPKVGSIAARRPKVPGR